jgi:hypothetical protein
MVRELIGIIKLKKYRDLNERYTAESLRDALRQIQRQELELLAAVDTTKE